MYSLPDFISRVVPMVQQTLDPKHQEAAWLACRSYFYDHRAQVHDPAVKEQMCLHLANYLATFGMYRNSFLMQYNHRIHEEAVEYLCRQNNVYWNYDPFFPNGNPFCPPLPVDFFCAGVSALAGTLADCYAKYSGGNPPTDTLISKILLGTLGCVPAYDNRVKKALFDLGLPQNYTQSGVQALVDDVNRDPDLVAYIRGLCAHYAPYLTPMRVVDMALWNDPAAASSAPTAKITLAPTPANGFIPGTWVQQGGAVLWQKKQD